MTNSSELFANEKRQKLINAIIFFVKKTRYCYKLKLLKLLYFFDFEHFRQTGKSVTGLKYKAWPMGPVAEDLFHEIDNPKPDMSEALTFKQQCFDSGKKYTEIKTKKVFDESIFTKRELLILERVADFFKDLNSEDMSLYSHDRKLPWKKVYDKGKGEGKEIEYNLALEAEPLMHELKTITDEELEYKKSVMEGF